MQIGGRVYLRELALCARETEAPPNARSPRITDVEEDKKVRAQQIALLSPLLVTHRDALFDASYSVAVVAGLVAGGAAVAIVAVPTILAAIGFGTIGVAAGSTAAAIQATMGGVIVKGSLFAMAQSAAMAGLSAGATAVTGAVGAVVGGAAAGTLVA